MKSLLDALQEGRLVELPTNDKTEVLEYCALLIEAIPGIGTKLDIVKEINARESEGNTGIGKGIACPHIRTKIDGELLCAIGWSPEGIDYGSPDGRKVHIVIMYYIPDSQRAGYLKELSSLAKAVSKSSDAIMFENVPDIHAIRNKLLDWVEQSIGDSVPDAKARMIKLEEKQRNAEISVKEGRRPMTVVPFTFVGLDAEKYSLLAVDADFLGSAEKSADLSKLLRGDEPLETGGYFISVLQSRNFASGRVLRECVAVKQS
jgi:nitrogen PTS system EIIA component